MKASDNLYFRTGGRSSWTIDARATRQFCIEALGCMLPGCDRGVQATEISPFCSPGHKRKWKRLQHAKESIWNLRIATPCSEQERVPELILTNHNRCAKYIASGFAGDLELFRAFGDTYTRGWLQSFDWQCRTSEWIRSGLCRDVIAARIMAELSLGVKDTMDASTDAMEIEIERLYD